MTAPISQLPQVQVQASNEAAKTAVNQADPAAESFVSKLNQAGKQTETAETSSGNTASSKEKSKEDTSKNAVKETTDAAQAAAMGLSMQNVWKQISFQQTDCAQNGIATSETAVLAVGAQKQPETASAQSPVALQAEPQQMAPEQESFAFVQEQTAQPVLQETAAAQVNEQTKSESTQQTFEQPVQTVQIAKEQPVRSSNGNTPVQADTKASSKLQKSQPATDMASVKQERSAADTQHELTGKEDVSSLVGNSAVGQGFDTAPVVESVSTQPATQAAPVQQLADGITQNLQDGRKEFTIDLFPRELGKVSVKLVSEGGMLTVELSAANPKTQSLLLSSAHEIKSILQMEQPVQVVDASQGKEWHQQQGEQQNQAQQEQQARQEQQKHQRAFEGSFSTDDFLTVMEQLRTQEL